MRLKGKIAIITGATSGIGKTTAILFAEHGAIVYALGRNEKKLKLLSDISNELKNKNLTLIPVKLDVTNREKINHFVKDVFEKHKKIDILINNAGIVQDNLLIRMKEEQWDKVININLKGVFNFTQAVVPYMLKNKSGVVLSTTSVVGIYGNPGQTNYVASKAGIIGMTKTWAKEYGKKGIRFNAIAPGFIETEMTEQLGNKVLENLKSVIPMQRTGKLEEVAYAFLFLASDEASYITGITLEVSGGMII